MVGGKAPLLFFLWYGEKLSLFPALRDDIPKLDDRLHGVLLELKATERDAAPLVALWKEEILPIVEVFFDDPGRS